MLNELTGAVVPCITLKEVAHGMACLSESQRGLNFVMSLVRDAIVPPLNLLKNEALNIRII